MVFWRKTRGGGANFVKIQNGIQTIVLQESKYKFVNYLEEVECKIFSQNGEDGILRYRGYPIEHLSRNELFSDVSYLLIYGELDKDASDSISREDFKNLIRKNANIHEDMKRFFDGFPLSAHPMAILSSMVTALSGFSPEPDDNNLSSIDKNIAKLLARVKTIAAYSYRKSHGLPFIYPDGNLSYVDNFLHMMFSDSQEEYHKNPIMTDALNLLLILHPI